MKLDTLEVAGLIPAMHGMRNPKKSWHCSDTVWGDAHIPIVGPKDMELAQRLINGGDCHSKFMRQIMVWVEITAPIYWWSEFDTYKVGVSRNSCSTMHTLISEIGNLSNNKEFLDWLALYDDRTANNVAPDSVLEMFEVSKDSQYETEAVSQAVANMYHLVKVAESTNRPARNLKKALKRILPSSWRQESTICMSYQNIRNMLLWRRNHDLSEWRIDFVHWAATLPYAKELLFLGMEDVNL